MSKRKMSGMSAESDPNNRPIVTGFIHNISPLKRSRNSNLYFEGQIQTSADEVKRLVCFSPDKINTFTNAQSSKKPVVLTNASLSPSPKGDVDVLVNNNTMLQISPQPVPFKYKVRRQDGQETTAGVPSVKSSLISLTRPSQMVSITAKVISLDEKTMTPCYGKPVPKMEVVVADATRQLPLTLWADFIEKVEKNKTYDFINISTRIYSGQLKLTTTFTSRIDPADDLLNAQEEDEKEEIITKLEFISANIVTKCGSCYKAIPDEIVGDTETECPNCNMFMLNSSLKNTTTLKINVNQNRLTAFDGTVRTFLDHVNKADLISSSRDLCRYLIHIPQVKLEYHNNIISKISLPSVIEAFDNNITDSWSP